MNIRSGQAKRPTTLQDIILPTPPTVEEMNAISTHNDFTQGDESDFSKTETRVETAEHRFEAIVQKRIVSACKPQLTTAVLNRMKLIRENLIQLLGDSDAYDSMQIDYLGNRIETKLNDQLQTALKSKTTALIESKTTRLEVDMDLDTEGVDNNQEGEVPVDIEADEEVIADDLRTGVDAICVEVGQMIPLTAGLVEKDALEYSLKKTMGKKYSANLGSDNLVDRYKVRSSHGTGGHSSGHHSSSTGHHSSGHHSSGHHSSGHHSSGHHSSSTHTESHIKRPAEETDNEGGEDGEDGGASDTENQEDEDWR